MLLLAVDTATPVVAVALHDGERTLAARAVETERRHGELLAPLVAEVLAEAGVRPAGLTAVVAGLGPGPYTGLRVGIVTAATLALSLDLPAYGACSLDALADGDGTVVTDARRGECYWATYRAGARVDGPAVSRPGDVPQDGGVRGPGVARHPEAFPGGTVAVLDAGRLAALAVERARAGAPSEPLHPLYLRRPDAAEPGRPKPVLA